MRLAGPPSSCKVSTPPDLASAIVNALGDGGDAIWLEPSHGTGVFVRAISRLGVQKRRIFAVDLDKTHAPADRLATTIRGVDFLRWAQNTDLRFDRIVGNPPFVSIRSLPISLQRTAEELVDCNNQTIGRGANLWYAFVVASLRLLKDGGSLAFVLPSAAEFADYSSGIRAVIRERFGSLELYRCARPLFDQVQEGTVVAVARKYKGSPCLVRRRRVQTKDELIHRLSQSEALNGHRCPVGSVRASSSTVTLGSVAKIRLGGVTGDARYFLMSESVRNELALPEAAFTRVVSKAKHLKLPCIRKRDWEALKASGHRVWLFNPSSEMTKNSKVKNYLKLNIDEGGCNREAYKVLNRAPWYSTPLPETADAFLSGMSQVGPWFCINEMRNLSATNTLYVVTFLSRRRNDWYRWALALLSSEAQRQLRRIERRYADGLIKYEPGALGEIKLPNLNPEVDHKSLYTRAVIALLSSDLTTAKNIADSARL